MDDLSHQAEMEALRALFAASPLPIITLDTEGRVRMWNTAAERILGWSQQEVLGRRLPTVPEDQWDEFERLMARVLSGERITSAEVTRRTRDGSPIELSISTALIRGTHGEALGAMAVYADVTERKRVERALRETELRYRTLVEQLPVPTYIAPLALDHAFFYVSPAIESMLGYPASAWVSTSGLWENLIHAEDRDRVLKADLGHMEHGGRFDMEYRLIARDGRVVWVRDVAVVLTDDAGHPMLQQGVLVDITERKRAEEALAHQALHDALTGLPNRTLLYDRLDRVIAASRRNQGTFALLLMDLDRFKEVNDTLGHHVGDLFLAQLAGRLSGALRKSDTVARLGGDEFALILPNTDRVGAIQTAEKILVCLEAPVQMEGHSLTAGASVGIAIFPEHGDEASTLLRRADIAMYRAKRSGTRVEVDQETDRSDT